MNTPKFSRFKERQYYGEKDLSFLTWKPRTVIRRLTALTETSQRQNTHKTKTRINVAQPKCYLGIMTVLPRKYAIL